MSYQSVSPLKNRTSISSLQLSGVKASKKEEEEEEEVILDDPEKAALQIIRISRKPQIVRTPFEMQILKNSIRNVKFFRQQFSNHYEDMMDDVCEFARPLSKFSHDIVIQQDDIGDLFYIIVKGEVKVTKKVITIDHKHRIEQNKVLTHLHNGDSFGELALLERQPRAATVTCVTDCFFLTLDKEAFGRIIKTKAKRDFIHLLDKLRENTLLAELSANTVKALFFTMERKVYNWGDVVYKVGEPSDAIYFIVEGEFKLIKEVFEPITEEQKQKMMFINRKPRLKFELKVVGDNECFGLDEFVISSVRQQQAICTSQQGVVYILDKNDFKRLEQRFTDTCLILREIALEKNDYYNELTQKVSYTKNQITPIQQAALKMKELNSPHEIKQIILQDKEMTFITKDTAALKEDKDIFMKFTKFFSPISNKSHRVTSAKHRPIKISFDEHKPQQTAKRPQTAQILKLESSKLQKKATNDKILYKLQKSQARCQSAISFQLSTKQQTDEDIKIPMSSVEQNLRKRLLIKQKTKTGKTVIQEKLQIFLQLNQDKIQGMAKELIQQKQNEEQNPKVVLKQKIQLNPTKKLVKRIQSTSQSRVQIKKILYQLKLSYFDEKKSLQIYSPFEETTNFVRGSQLKRNKQKIEVNIQQGIHNAQTLRTPESTQQSYNATPIHNLTDHTGIAQYRNHVFEQVSSLQLPLKYFSTMLNKCGENSNRYQPKFYKKTI